jgi:hypothetical protein
MDSTCDADYKDGASATTETFAAAHNDRRVDTTHAVKVKVRAKKRARATRAIYGSRAVGTGGRNAGSVECRAYDKAIISARLLHKLVVRPVRNDERNLTLIAA